MSEKIKNPFIITFGKKPIEYIHRPVQTDEILSMFTGDPITNQIYIISGVRGAGKTVLLYDIANRLEEDSQWLVIRCAPTSDILHTLAKGLERAVAKKKISIDGNITIPGIGGVHFQEKQTSSDDKYIIEDALRALADQGKKLLITVDEITNTHQMQDFASNLQIWMGEDYPVFFLGTALYEQIEEIRNIRNLTFLYRAPRINLEPLDLISIALTYRKALDVDTVRSEELSRLTCGYSFAFQALGYIYWNAMPVQDLDEILPDYDAMLSNSSYSKMWQEMSSGDRQLCVAIAECRSSKVGDIRLKLGETDANRFNQRRIRLKDRGIIDTSERGKILFSLPRFAVFVENTVRLYGI